MRRNTTLVIVNGMSICEGNITRQRITTIREERAVLDLYIVCTRALPYIESMKVDEKQEYQLSNFHGLRAGKKTTFTDHNIVTLNCRFEMSSTQPQRTELFDFKNKEGQQQFYELTTKSTKLSECFIDKRTFLQQSQRWFRCLNSFFYQCFTKIRSQKRKHEPSKVDKLLEERKKLRRLSAEDTFQDYNKKIQDIEEEVGKITNWQDADHIWDKFQQVTDSEG